MISGWKTFLNEVFILLQDLQSTKDCPVYNNIMGEHKTPA